jgi:hypothetical protein
MPSTHALFQVPHMIQRILRVLAAAGLLASGSAVFADVVVEGYHFPDTVTVSGQNLLLNGAGVSTIFSFKATAVGFYLPKKETTEEGACGVKGAKRIQLYMLRDVSARDLSNVLLDRIRQNVSTDEFAANIVQTAQLGAVFGSRQKVLKGDMLEIDYNPVAQTSEFSLNGQKVGDTIKGEAFFPMMMKVWIGPKVRGATRDALLAGGTPHH